MPLKRALIISTLLVSIFLVGVSSFWIWYNLNPKWRVHECPDFDLFLAEVIFRDYETFSFAEEGDINPDPVTFKQLPISIYKRPIPEQKLDIDWVVDIREFEAMDSVHYGILNTSGEKLYYMTWGSPISRMRVDYFIHRNGTTDTLEFGGFGCATGIYLTPLAKGDSAKGARLNPLLRNPYSNYDLDVKSDSFPEVFRSLYGDSVGIRFRLPTYSLPWSSHRSQMIESGIYTASTSKLIEAWKAAR